MCKRLLAATVAVILSLVTVSAPVAATIPERSMGLEFVQQQQTGTPVDNPVSLASFPQQLVNNIQFPVHKTAILDVRAFNTLYFYLEATLLNGGTWTATTVLNVTLAYYADPAGNTLVFQDEYNIYRTDLGGDPGSGPLNFSDVIYGPYLQMFVSQVGGGGAQSLTLAYEMFGSFRSLAGGSPRLRSGLEPNGMLYRIQVNLAGGTNTQSPAVLGYGKAMVTLLSGPAGGATLSWTYAGNALYTDSITTAAPNTRVQKEIILPKRQMRMTLTNNAGGLQAIEAYVILDL